MVLCMRCAGIDLISTNIYMLQDYAQVTILAKGGCEGCKFFSHLVELHLKQELEDHQFVSPRRLALVRLFGAEDSQVELQLWDGDAGALKLRGAVALRLCSVIGERLPSISFPIPDC